MWFVTGFFAFGGMVGLLAGLSSAEISQSLLALLFALISGSIVVLLNKIAAADRAILGKLLLAFSVACSLGLTLGISTKVNQWLSFIPDSNHATGSVYLRANELNQSEAIERQYRTGQITGDDAYQRLNSLLSNAAGDE